MSEDKEKLMTEDWLIEDVEKNGTTTGKLLCKIIRKLQLENENLLDTISNFVYHQDDNK